MMTCGMLRGELQVTLLHGKRSLSQGVTRTYTTEKSMKTYFKLPPLISLQVPCVLVEVPYVGEELSTLPSSSQIKITRSAFPDMYLGRADNTRVA